MSAKNKNYKCNYETPPAEKHNNCCETACLVSRPSATAAAVQERPRCTALHLHFTYYYIACYVIPRVEITVLLRCV